MIRIDDLGLFVRTAALGSFSNAAREAGLLPGQVSAAIQRLERELDIRLFARSTRSLKLTAEGEQYLPYAQEVLATLSEGRDRLHGERQVLRGSLRISAPSDLGRNVLPRWLGEFREAHPGLVLKLSLSDELADVFRDPVDVALRYGVAEHGSFVALPLAEHNRRVLVASPDYLARHGRPASLDELGAHRCLLFVRGGRVYDRWVFPEGEGRRLVAVGGGLHCDDADLARRWAVDGFGVAYKSWARRASRRAGRPPGGAGAEPARRTRAAQPGLPASPAVLARGALPARDAARAHRADGRGAARPRRLPGAGAARALSAAARLIAGRPGRAT